MSTWWQQLNEGLREDFSDLGNPAVIFRIAVRLLLAALLGGIVGYEREHEGKSAGLRTHMLVALGAALFVLAGDLTGMLPADRSRVIQGIVTGIGFLGAGTIIKHADADHVRGLTTAAGIWMTAAIGVAAGVGREGLAILGTIFGLVVLTLIRHAGGSSRS